MFKSIEIIIGKETLAGFSFEKVTAALKKRLGDLFPEAISTIVPRDGIGCSYYGDGAHSEKLAAVTNTVLAMLSGKPAQRSILIFLSLLEEAKIIKEKIRAVEDDLLAGMEPGNYMVAGKIVRVMAPGGQQTRGSVAVEEVKEI